MEVPEPPQRGHEPKGDVGVGGVDRETKRGPEVVVLLLQLVQPPSLTDLPEVGLGGLGEGRAPGGVSRQERRALAGGIAAARARTRGSSRASRTRLARRPPASADTGSCRPATPSDVEDAAPRSRRPHRLGRLERAAAARTPPAAGRAPARSSVEQVVAPGDRVAQRPLPLGQVARARRSAAARRCSSRASSAAGGSSRARAAASSIASGSPSSRRQISATAAAFASRQREVRARRPRARSTNSAHRLGPARAPRRWRPRRAGSASGGTG